MKPRIVAIAGLSGSGKTALAQEVIRRLSGRCSLLPLDSYYRPLPSLTIEQRAVRNYDHPDALDWALLDTHLAELAEGRAVAAPIYLFDQHTRSRETRTIAPNEVILVEGILALHREAIRTMAKVRAFVATSEVECLRRRMERDMAERGRSRESVLAQYHATVWPMAVEYVLPSRQHADVMISGEEPLEQTAGELLRLIL